MQSWMFLIFLSSSNCSNKNNTTFFYVFSDCKSDTINSLDFYTRPSERWLKLLYAVWDLSVTITVRYLYLALVVLVRFSLLQKIVAIQDHHGICISYPLTDFEPVNIFPWNRNFMLTTATSTSYLLDTAIIWDVMTCSLLELDSCFRGTYCLSPLVYW
jgi:hypothetical protein